MTETTETAAVEPTDNVLTDAAPELDPKATETPLEAPSEADKPEDDEADKRMARLAHEAREARRKTRTLEREIAVLKGQRQEQPDEEIDRKVNERAQQLAATQVFNNRCNEIYQDGVKAFGKAEFDESVKELNDALGGMSVALIEAADDTGHAAKVLHYLGDNSDIAEKLAALPPHKMGVELAKIATKLDSPKKLSKAPPPIKVLNGAGTTGETDLEKMSMAEYMQHENERRLKGYH